MPREPDWSESVYLENEREQRFVRVVQDRARSVVAYGALTTPGQQRERTHEDAQAAARWCRRRVATLRHKGYRLGHCRAGLVEAIQDAPDSLSAYGAYAEWLNQKGDPRGELITLGLQRLTSEVSPEHQRAFDALLAKHPETLDVATLARSTRQRWHAGFVRAGVVDVRAESRAYDFEAGDRLRSYLTHPSLAAVQHVTVLGYDPALWGVIAEATPRTIQQLELRYRGPVHPWAPFEPPNGDGLLFRWQPRLPLLRSVECLGMGRAEEREDEPAPRGMWAKLRWWLGW